MTAMIRDPQGRQNIVEAMMEDRGDNVYRCTYRPTQAGPHAVTVTFAGVGIPKSPFNVDVGPGELLELRSIIQLFRTHSLRCMKSPPRVCFLPGSCSLCAGGLQGNRSGSAAVRDEGETGRRHQGGHQKRRQWRPEGARQRTQ